MNCSSSKTAASSAKMMRSAGMGPSRSASRPPQRLPTATDTPYTSITQPTAPALKPEMSVRMGARKVNGMNVPP
ncbi:hypothetical protein D3C71_1748720 [compost metagenome]